MVGQVADNFDQQVSQRNFNCLIDVNATANEKEEKDYQTIPDIYNFDDIGKVLEYNRNRICNDIAGILRSAT